MRNTRGWKSPVLSLRKIGASKTPETTSVNLGPGRGPASPVVNSGSICSGANDSNSTRSPTRSPDSSA